ncbi:MAG: PadR family transcriptional regulator [Candidatus Omnitrophota bacterium]
MLQELLILGLLKERPKHGYEIKKEIKDVLGPFAGLETKSIYYPLKNLEKQNFLTRQTGKAGRRPEKYTYTLTASGKKRFEELLSKSFLTIQRPFLNVDLSLFFLPYAEKNIVISRLKTRIKRLNHINDRLKQMSEKLKNNEIKYNLFAIVEHNLQLINMEIEFISNLVEYLEKKEKELKPQV